MNPTLTLSFPQNQQKEPSNGHSLSTGETVTHNLRTVNTKPWKKKHNKNYINTKDEKFQYAFVYRSLKEHCICRSPKKRKEKKNMI